MKREELGFNLFLLAVVILMLVVNLDYRPRARRIPMLTGLCTLGLLAGVTVQLTGRKNRGKFEKGTATGPDDAEAEARDRRDAGYAGKEAVIILWLVGLTAAMYLVGFLVAIPLYLFLFLYFFAKETWKVSLGMAVGVFAVIYLLFVKVLNVHVHQGLIF